MAILVLAGAAPSAEPTEEFLAALRDHRLDQLLEAFCRRELAAGAGGGAAGLAAIELSRSLARRAAQTTDAIPRARIWHEAYDVLTRVAETSSDPFTRSQLELHLAALLFAEGQWQREWEELMGNPAEAVSARAPLERALEVTEELRRRMEQSLEGFRKSKTGPSRDDSLARWEELAGLANLRLGMIRTALARSLPLDDSRREELLTLAVDNLIPIAGSPSEIAATATLTLCDALRGLGRPEEALVHLSVLAGPLDKATEDRVLAERVEVLLAQDRTLEALEILYRARQAADPRAAEQRTLPVEWEFLYLKVLLAQANQMRDDPLAIGKLQASALQRMRALESLGDPLWVRRAEALFRQHARDLLLRNTTEYRQAAQTLLRTGDYAKAAEVFFRAAEQAEQRGTDPDAIGLFQEASRTWEQARSFDKARDLLVRIERRWPDHPAAAEWLLRAAINARRAYLASASQQDYALLDQLARRHHQRFPDDPTAGEIHYLLGSLRYAERNWEDALAQFLSIRLDHPLHKAGLLAASRTYEAWKAPLGDSTSEIPSALDFLERIRGAAPSGAASGEGELDWTAEERAELDVRFARFCLDPRSNRPDKARAVAQRLSQDPAVAHQWRQQAQGLLVLAFAHELEFAKAEQAVAGLSAAPEELFYLLEVLNRRSDGVGEIERRMIGRVQARILERLDAMASSQTEAEPLPWTLTRLRARMNRGETTITAEANQRLQELRTAHPRDALVLEVLAVSYARLGKPGAAVEIWRELVRGLPERTPSWFRAKLELVRSLRADGKFAQAREALQLLEAVHPDLGGPVLAKEFQAEHERLIGTRTPVE